MDMTYYVAVKDRDDELFRKVSKDYKTESEAIDFLNDNRLDDKHRWVSIFTTPNN